MDYNSIRPVDYMITRPVQYIRIRSMNYITNRPVCVGYIASRLIMGAERNLYRKDKTLLGHVIKA